MAIERGDTGRDVITLQNALCTHGYPCAVDGIFGAETERVVIAYQAAHSLEVDGVVGTFTRAVLGMPASHMLVWVRVPAHPVAGGYNSHRLRTDIASDYMYIYDYLDALGGVVSSAGSKRYLGARVSANRSAVSLHYIGRAFDLATYSGMQDPSTDAYIVTLDRDRYWRVYVKVQTGGEVKTIKAWDKDLQLHDVTARVVDFTALAKQHGFRRIRGRKKFFDGGPYGGAEWWHFESHRGLGEGVTLFGDELRKLYSESELAGTPPWKYKDRVWNGKMFAREL